MSTNSDYRQQVEKSLTKLAKNGGELIRQERAKETFNKIWSKVTPSVLIAPAILFVLAIPLLWGGSAYLPALWLGALITLAIPVLALALPVFVVENRDPSRRQALEYYDRHQGLKDRLRAADEFLSAEDSSSFGEAAIQEALPHAEKALEHEPQVQNLPWPGSIRDVRYLVVAALLLIIPHLFSTSEAVEDKKASAEPSAEELQTEKKGQEETTSPSSTTKPSTQKSEPRREGKSQPPSDELPVKMEPKAQLSGDSNQNVLENEGKTKGGQPAFAPSTGRSQKSRGVPGTQAPTTKPHDKSLEPKKPKKKKKSKKEDDPQHPRKKADDKSGATAGRGSSSGSSRNPAASEWSSKDRVAESEEQEFEEEEDVDDEDSESEARGGLQPNLRDRRPPTNRDLSIGFGNRSNPDANGRGGPGQRKKSRGVASLVLGVPIPDHVKGQPNPGRVKITQERVRPQREASEPADAQDRPKRDRAPELLSRRTLLPWMRQVLKNYFNRDSQASTETTNEKKDS